MEPAPDAVVAQGSEEELGESLGLLTPEQKKRLLTHIRGKLAEVQRELRKVRSEKNGAHFAEAIRWAFLMLALDAIRSNSLTPTVNYGFTFDGIISYVEKLVALRREDQEDEDEVWP